ncbi:MAG: endolytic transglycosylase MltG [Rhodospirillaceae bacterium]|nr:endolytic transglycosylase MltG [Rhodospirillaceae bacterium]
MRRFLLIALALCILVAAAAAGGGAWWFDRAFHKPGPTTEEVTLVVPRGASVAAIGDQLAEAGLLEHDWVFEWGVRIYGRERPLKAGEYIFTAGISPAGLMSMLSDGRQVQHRLTIPEGLTNRQVLDLVAAADMLSGDAPDASRFQEEGAFLPETYFYSYGDDRAALVERMNDAMRRTLAELWEARADDLPFNTPKAALTLASIVEKETSLESERARIAGVFVNRLERGMMLQSDPTVIYAVTQGEAPLGRLLTYDDLAIDDPYNTYRYAGLPPGPIANPGRDAIEAVLNPEATEDLYFVADGTGGHAFAKTLSEHNRNVAHWRKIRAQQIEDAAAAAAEAEAAADALETEEEAATE